MLLRTVIARSSSTATGTGRCRRSSPISTPAGPFAVDIENWQHDLNVRTVVRAASPFLGTRSTCSGVGGTVAGRWWPTAESTSGTSPTTAELEEYAPEAGNELVRIDNLPGSGPLESFAMLANALRHTRCPAGLPR